MKILSLPEHPARLYIETPPAMDRFLLRPRARRPAGVRLRGLLHSFDFRPPPVMPYELPRTSPWLQTRLQIDFSLTRCSKCFTSPDIYRRLFL